MEKQLVLAGGVFHLALLVFHLLFWRLFRWPASLENAGLINRQVIQIMNLCLIVVFAAFAWLEFRHADEMLGSPLGHSLLAIIAVFWIARSAEQVYFFGLRNVLSAALFSVFCLGAGLHSIAWYCAVAD